MRTLLKLLLLNLFLCGVCYAPVLKPFRGAVLPHGRPSSRNLASYWSLNEGIGDTINDLSGNNNTGTLVADTHFVAGKFGSALDFDGSGDYANCGNKSALQITGPMTVSLWVSCDDFSTTPWICSKWTGTGSQRGWGIIFLTDGTPRFYVSSNGVSSSFTAGPGTVSTGEYNLLTGVYDGSNLIMYVNGVPGTPTAYSSDIFDSSTIVQISGYGAPAGPSQLLNGQVDHMLIHNRALTAREITELYREPFRMFVKDDIAKLGSVVTPPAPGGQVITIIMTSIPLFLIPFFFIKRRKSVK